MKFTSIFFPASSQIFELGSKILLTSWKYEVYFDIFPCELANLRAWIYLLQLHSSNLFYTFNILNLAY